jgi:hypothetical protein
MEIDAGTLTEQTTDDAPPLCWGSSGPSGPTLDAGTITLGSTDDASASGPSPARWRQAPSF